MSESKYTPGPWRWTQVDYAKGTRGYAEKENGPFDALWSDSVNAPVAVAQDASSYVASLDFPNEADSNLIAAAPDLLEIVRDVVCDGRDHINPSLYNLAVAALRKATGGVND